MAEKSSSKTGILVGAAVIVIGVVAFFVMRTQSDVTLVVQTSPEGATVKLLEPAGFGEIVAKGGGAVFANLPRGAAYRATIDLEGHKQRLAEGTLPDAAGEHQVKVDLEAEAAIFAVATEPPGAMIYLDNKEQGKSPVVLSDVPPGQHAISARLDGFAPLTRMVTANAGVEEKLLLVLQKGASDAGVPAGEDTLPGYGRVIVTSSHKARIIVDNNVIGEKIDSINMQVGEGKHRVTAAVDGLDTKWKMVQVAEGAVVEVEFEFDDEAPLKKAYDATNPKKPLYWVVRGGSSRNEGKYGDAVDMFKKALELDPNDVSAHRQLSRTYPALKDWDGAIEHAEEYLRLQPDAPDAKFTREMLDLYQQAKEAQNEGKEFKPKFPGVGFRPEK
jgi:hypothetical protein